MGVAVIPVGSTVGVLGGGQLGRYLCVSARQAGYRAVIRTDEAPGGPAAQVADGEYNGPYDDAALNGRFVDECDVITSEFENLPVSLLRDLAMRRPVRPGANSIGVCQHRLREKQFLAAHAIPHAPFAVVRSAVDVRRSLMELGGTAILKTAAFGYDGRGQIRLDASSNVDAKWEKLATPEAVLEQMVPFLLELSVVGARGLDGEWTSFPPSENVHVDGILDYTVAPARVTADIAKRADELARSIAAALDHVGTIAVEFFLLADGALLVNEMAPRPHNSGHHTIDACRSSQFDLQLRAATGAPLGDSSQNTAAVMVNLLGDLWSNGEPDWSAVAGDSHVRLHLYGKSEPKPGRKMGHLTVLGAGQPPAELLNEALRRRSQLRSDVR